MPLCPGVTVTSVGCLTVTAAETELPPTSAGPGNNGLSLVNTLNTCLSLVNTPNTRSPLIGQDPAASDAHL